jgi:UPF0755 protein
VFELGEPSGGAYSTPAGEEWEPISPRWGPMRRALVVLVTMAVVVGVLGISGVRWLDRQIHPSGPQGEALEFVIEPRQTTNVIASNLAAKDVISNATIFRYWLRRQSGSDTFQAGKYDLAQRMSFPAVLEALRAGPKPPLTIRVTVPPGLTMVQMEQRILEQIPTFDADELRAALLRQQIDADYVPPLPFPIREGLLFPDTYNVAEDAVGNEFALVRRMRDQMDKVLDELDAGPKAEALGVSVYEILIIASLIEREAKIDADRPKIARVIYNRLAIDMTLGIDASTRYAVGKFGSEPLTRSDLASESPYNTRRQKGLPPTPIAGPSRASIEAALNPTPDGKWLYYVLTDEGGVPGAHLFAETAREFEAGKRICTQLGYCG